MARWGSGIPCPKKCGGKLDVYEDDEQERKPAYCFICSHCDFQGNWRWLGAARKRARRQT